MPAFEVEFGCGNCGASWSDEFGPRTTVEKAAGTSRVSVRNDECDELGKTNCDCCDVVRCPVCERYRDVAVNGRQPVREEYQ